MARSVCPSCASQGQTQSRGPTELGKVRASPPPPECSCPHTTPPPPQQPHRRSRPLKTKNQPHLLIKNNKTGWVTFTELAGELQESSGCGRQQQVTHREERLINELRRAGRRERGVSQEWGASVSENQRPFN